MPFIAAAFVAVGALTATVAQVAIVVSTIGTGLSIVGKITGSEDLMKIGGIMAIAGGVTSLASGAMTAFNAATTAASGAGAAEGALSLAGQDIAATAYSGIDPTPMFSGAGEAAASSIGDVAMGGQSMPSFNDVRFEAQGGGLLNSTPTMPQAQTFEPVANDAGMMPSQDQLPNEWNKLVSQNAAAPAGADTNALKDWWDKLDSTTKNTVMNMGGKAVGGLFDGWNAEQKQAFEREKYNLFNSNANAQPSISYKQVAGARPVGGLLNARAA